MWNYKVILECSFMIAPKTKQRPRFNGRFAYTPKQTRDYEALLKTLIKSSFKGERVSRETPVGVDLALYAPPLKTKKRELPTMGLDIDNAAKAVLDAMNGIVYVDDSQVCDLTLKKRYDLNPRIELKVYIF